MDIKSDISILVSSFLEKNFNLENKYYEYEIVCLSLKIQGMKMSHPLSKSLKSPLQG